MSGPFVAGLFRRIRELLAAKVDILVFALERPGRADLVLNAATGHPAGLRTASAKRNAVVHSALPHVAISETARPVEEGVAERQAEPPTGRAKPIDALMVAERRAADVPAALPLRSPPWKSVSRPKTSGPAWKL